MSRKRKSTNAMNPLPSLLRASAHDAGNFSMRRAGRSKWNDDDWNAMVETQDRLIRHCYGRETDADPRMMYIRFSLAEQLQRQGDFNLYSDFAEIMAFIDECLEAPAEQAA